jgi:NADPH:quinone reductase-like Zn-dependent oxidoreductase
MKAILYEKQTAPDILVYREAEKPVPGENEVLVQIRCASVNALDYRSLRMGILPKNKIFGADISGVVAETGSSVRQFRAGDAVIADLSGCGMGGFAQYAAVPANALIHKPESVSFEDAAALPVAALTALQGLRKGGIQAGQHVLICGASGGVGTYALQLAKNFGAKVTAVCSAKHVQQTYALCAGHVIDYRQEDFTKGKERYDLILAVNGNYPLFAYKHALTPGGTAVVLGGALSQIFKTIAFGPLMSMGGKKIKMLAAKPCLADLSLLAGLAAQGLLKPVIDKRFSLSDAAEAVRYAEKGHPGGKIMITVAE